MTNLVFYTVLVTFCYVRAAELIRPVGYAKVATSGSTSLNKTSTDDVQNMWLPSELVAAYNAKKYNATKETGRAMNVYPEAYTQKSTRMDPANDRKYYPNFSLSDIKNTYNSMERDRSPATGEVQDRFFPGQYTPQFGNKNKGYPPAGPPKSQPPAPAPPAPPKAPPVYLPPPPNTYGPPQGDFTSFNGPPSAQATDAPSAPPAAMQPEPSPAMSPPDMMAPQTYMAPPSMMSAPSGMDSGHDHDHHHHAPMSAPASAPMSDDHQHHHHHDDNIKYAPLGEHEYYTPPPGYEHDHHEDHGYAFHDHHHDYEEFHHDHPDQPPPSTMAPMMMKEEERDTDKYSYYYIGRKLWYIPLYFSIYFIIYIAVVIAKSIARHKIQYPTHFKTRRDVSQDDLLQDLTVYITRILSENARKYIE